MNLKSALALLLCGVAACAGAERQDDFTLLFNGTDLTGWGYKSGEKFDGKKESSDARYTAKDGMIVVNPGKGIAQLWTTQEFPKDFELRLDFRARIDACPDGRIRGIGLQRSGARSVGVLHPSHRRLRGGRHGLRDGSVRTLLFK